MARRVSHSDGRSRDAAVRQNAAWCDLVCRSHGLETALAADAWTCGRRSPPLYPDAVTLQPAVEVDRLLARIDSGPGCSIKDSYAAIDLTPCGFDVLFDATWVAATGTGSDTTWRSLTTSAELAAWHAAWLASGGTEGVLDPSRLASHDIAFVGEIVDGEVRAGAVLHTSDGVLGAGNLFGQDAWREVIASVDAGTTVVGYERGDDLARARAAGAIELGPLRVWLRRASGG